MNQTQDSYRGALAGAAIGDALGSTVDDMSREQIKQQLGIHRELAGGGRLKLKPGQPGDDTAFTLAVAASIVEHKAVDSRDIMNRMAAAFTAGGGKGAGPVSTAVFSAYKPRGKDLYSAARKVNDTASIAASLSGAGAVLRCAPIGMFHRLNFKELVTETIQLCRLTHMDQRAVDSCIAFNFGVSYLTSGKDPSKLLFKTWRFLTEARTSKDYIELIGEEEVSQDMVKALKSVNDLQYDELDPSGTAIELVQAAYWLTLNAIDFEEGLVRAVNLGGDAATLGGVAGTLLGARFGEAAIPERWLKGVNGMADIQSMSDKLFKMAEPKK